MPKVELLRIDRLGFKSIGSLANALGVDSDYLKEMAELCANKYPYRARWEPKASGGGKRLIEVPAKELKVLHSRINGLLQRLRLPSVFHGCCIGTHTKTNAAIHIGQKHFESFDLQDYYLNLSHRKVFTSLMQQGCSVDVSSLLTRLTTVHGHVPQGAPSSPMLAAIALLSAHSRFRQLCERIDATFGIFGDNVAVSGPRHLKHHASTFQNILFSEGFRVNLDPKKRVSKTSNEPWPLPGVEIFQRSIDVADADFERVANLFARSQAAMPAGLANAVCPRFETKLRGQMFHYRWIGDEGGTLTSKARRLVEIYESITWPNEYLRLPCEGDACECEP
jgi:hypothetical protein